MSRFALVRWQIDSNTTGWQKNIWSRCDRKHTDVFLLPSRIFSTMKNQEKIENNKGLSLQHSTIERPIRICMLSKGTVLKGKNALRELYCSNVSILFLSSYSRPTIRTCCCCWLLGNEVGAAMDLRKTGWKRLE